MIVLPNILLVRLRHVKIEIGSIVSREKVGSISTVLNPRHGNAETGCRFRIICTGMSKELRAIEDERHKIEDEASMDIFWMFAFLFVAVCVCWLLLNYCLEDSGRQGGRPKYDSLNYDTWVIRLRLRSLYILLGDHDMFASIKKKFDGACAENIPVVSKWTLQRQYRRRGGSSTESSGSHFSFQ